jgi:hypothetical protein
VLVITNTFSKVMELVAIPDKEALMVASAFFSRWVCRWSCLRQIVTDRGREFCNKLLEELLRLLEVDHKKTAAYHPQMNTTAESFNCTLIKIMTAALENPDEDWEAWLLVVTLTYNMHTCGTHLPYFDQPRSHPWDLVLPFLRMQNLGPKPC